MSGFLCRCDRDLLSERGIDICNETVRFWWNRFGPLFAAEIRKRWIHVHSHSNWRWLLDEVFVRINGETHYLWRAVDHEAKCSRFSHRNGGIGRAALTFSKRAMKRYAPAAVGSTTGRKFTPAVQATGRGNGKIPGRQDPAEFAAVHASIHNHFSHDRRLSRRDIFKQHPLRRVSREARSRGSRSIPGRPPGL